MEIISPFFFHVAYFSLFFRAVFFLEEMKCAFCRYLFADREKRKLRIVIYTLFKDQ